MKCPYCSSPESKVLDKRSTPGDKAIRRRRECLSCSKRFTTHERVESADIIVVKKSGEREQFDRQKLKRGIQKACEKRPISNEAIEQIVDEIEKDMREMKSVEIPSRKVGELVMKRLKKIDKVAYIRFASVYREFTDLESFQKELSRLVRK